MNRKDPRLTAGGMTRQIYYADVKMNKELISNEWDKKLLLNALEEAQELLRVEVYAFCVLDDRLRTRFEGGLMADIAPPDLETRMAIARNKASRLGLFLPDDIIEYIASTITANVRQLEGVIKRLTAYKEILNSDITRASVDRAIEDVIKKGTDIPKPDNIIRETAKYYSLKPEDLKGNNRSKNTAMARQISMYLMRQLTNLSLNDIGKELGRNHTTALSSIRKIEELMRSDPDMTGVIRDITSNITTSSGSA